MDPTFNIEGLKPYIKQNRDELITRFMLKGKTIDRIALRQDIKTSEAIHYGDIDVTFRNGRGCGFQADGQPMNLTDRILTTALLEVDKEFCADDLLGTYAESLVKIGASEAELPFEQYIAELIVNKIAEKLEKLIWQGDTSRVDELKWIDGFLKIAENEADTVEVELPAGSSYYELVKAVYMAMPEEVLAQASAAIHVQPSIFRALRQELLEKNYFHHSIEDAEVEEFNWPGSDVKVVKTLGLAGTGIVYASFDRNLVYGCDKESQKKDLKIGYEEKTDTFWAKVRFNAGVQVYFPDWVVVGAIGSQPGPGPEPSEVHITEITLPYESVTIGLGATYNSSASAVAPEGYTDEIAYESSNSAVASVDANSGVVSALAPGVATILARAYHLVGGQVEYTGAMAMCEVTVESSEPEPTPEPFAVALYEDAAHTIPVAGPVALSGASLTLYAAVLDSEDNIIPSENSDYFHAEVLTGGTAFSAEGFAGNQRIVLTNSLAIGDSDASGVLVLQSSAFPGLRSAFVVNVTAPTE